MEKETDGKALYYIDITKAVGSEYIGMFNDLARFIIIQISIQIMLCTLDPKQYNMFSSEFMILLLFVIIGVLIYWLVFKKLVAFK